MNGEGSTGPELIRVVLLQDDLTGMSRADLLENQLMAAQVRAALERLNCQVFEQAFGLDRLQELAQWFQANRTDLVFNLVDTVQGSCNQAFKACEFLDQTGIPYTGSDGWAMALTTDKVMAKQMMQNIQIPTPDWYDPASRRGFVINQLYIIKPVADDGSVNISQQSVARFAAEQELLERLELEQARTGMVHFAERYIEGREFNISIIGQQGEAETLPVAEIQFHDFDSRKLFKILTFDAKWTVDTFEYDQVERRYVDVAQESDLCRVLVGLAKTCWRRFGLRGYARIDFRVDDKGQPWVMEINTNPSISDDCATPAAAQQKGYDYRELIRRIIKEAAPGLSDRLVSYQNQNQSASAWQQQFKRRLTDPADLTDYLPDDPEVIRQIRQTSASYPMAITPHYLSLIDPQDANCPIRSQAIPNPAELADSDEGQDDPLHEEQYSPVPGLIHRYPDRVLLLVTLECATYCRHCTRKRKVGDRARAIHAQDIEQGLDYIRQHPAIRDVLISGGDPLILSDERLEAIVRQIRAIPHVEVIRIGTRIPVVLPQRITRELVDRLKKYHPIWIHTHFNHPRELTPESAEALSLLAEAGFPLGNQTVLLKGVNDSAETLKQLCHLLVKNRVRPYYLYLCDPVRGIGHFRTSLHQGLSIIRQLQGHTSGFAVPQLVLDAPGGGGKILLHPDLLRTGREKTLILRNFEGRDIHVEL